MSHHISAELLKVAAMQLAYTAGFDRTNTSAAHLLSDVMIRYLEYIAVECSRVATHQQRGSVHFDDLLRAFSFCGVDMKSLKEYGSTMLDVDNIASISLDPITGIRMHFPRATPKHIPECPYVHQRSNAPLSKSLGTTCPCQNRRRHIQ
ncbi:hypothetical protein BC829DRAFT_161233 [Chytridium lagenaria]|nr:hypothetical protein BC829DRAFT_161233 [Chytridium lagenaria]